MELILNGTKIDYKDNYEDLIKSLLLFCISRIDWQALDLIKENVAGFGDLLNEGLIFEKETVKDHLKKREIASLIRRINNFIKYFPKYQDRNSIKEGVYNFILALEGKGLLSGFGFGNRFGDKLKGNAERKSLYFKQ